MDSLNPHPPVTDPLGEHSAAALRELQERARAAISARRDHVTQLEADITAQLETITAALAGQQSIDPEAVAQADEAGAEMGRLRGELEDIQATSQLERAAWESEREALEQERTSAEAERSKFKTEQATWETERSTFESERAAWEIERALFAAERATWDAEHKAWKSERSAWETERNELSAKAVKQEAEQRSTEAVQQASHHELLATQDEWRKRLADVEQKLLDERAAGNLEQAAWKEMRAGLEREHKELQQKFELALEDVQRFRGRVTELEQDLARRPATGGADSAEVVALRAERDALAERIKKLEQEQVTSVDADAEQQRADLQRRFEMAVEDVRELKTKNAKLEAQLSDSRKHSGGGPDAGGMDWESQKRRLLESLEGGGADGADPVAQEERATIENTIEITDAVVAEKDAEIAALVAELAAGGGTGAEPASDDATREEAISKLLDADEVIAQHRKRVAQIEQEMEAKLRAAELELSVERAKIARNRAELEDLRVELESQRQSLGTNGAPSVVGAPKRRWLSKLGLSGEEET